MGDHRHNPFSKDYLGKLPEAVIGCSSQATVEPTEEWIATSQVAITAAKEAGTDGSLRLDLQDKDRDVVIRTIAVYCIPMKTLEQNQWPKVTVPAGEIRIPLLQLKKLVKDALSKDNPGLADMVKLEDEPKVTLQ
jgi:hypothetical protein